MKFTQTKSRAVTVAAVLLVSVVAASVAFSGVGLASVDTADRTVGETVVEPGDSVAVSVELTVTDGGDRLTIQDDFTHAGAAEAGDLQHNGESIDPVIFAVDDRGLTVAAEESFEDGDTVTVEYTVTVADAVDSDETVSFDGTAGIDEQEDVDIGGDSSVEIAENPIASADRSLDPTTVDAGETATVDLALELDDDADRITVFEDYERVSDATVQSVTHDGESVDPVIDAIDDESLTIGLEEPFEDGDTVEISYSVSVPEDAADDTEYAFTGVATADNQPDVQIIGDDSLTVDVDDSDDTSPAPSPPPTPSPDPAAFDISTVEANSSISVDETLTVTATVENTGDEDDEQDVSLLLDGDVVDSDTTALDGDEAADVTLSTTFDDAGEYDMVLETEDDSTDLSFTVTKADDDDTEEDDTEEDETEDEDADDTEQDDETEDDTADDEPADDDQPGFGVLVTLVGVVAVLIVGHRRT
ncbi:PGF-CTERM sorting domain-containing protein [Natranaeroarchaeum sulfidigenes]|nr:PGF-CTERM sorting domain-containing protein [Natranaeroarchaeum sulfidigenes]